MKHILVAALVLATASLAVAEEVVVQPESKPFTLMGWLNERQLQLDSLPVPGDSAEGWLAMQREGNMASENPQAATRELREKAAERFLKTYDFPITENVYGTDFKAGD